MAKYEQLHDWSLTPREAVELQKQLRARVRITPLGKKVHDEASTRVEQIDALMTAALSRGDSAALRRMLETCIDHVERSSRGPLELPDEPEPLEDPDPARR